MQRLRVAVDFYTGKPNRARCSKPEWQAVRSERPAHTFQLRDINVDGKRRIRLLNVRRGVGDDVPPAAKHYVRLASGELEGGHDQAHQVLMPERRASTDAM